jgi:hypothetical protein
MKQQPMRRDCIKASLLSKEKQQKLREYLSHDQEVRLCHPPFNKIAGTVILNTSL